ncbi:Cutinase [Paramyrothecium foliicola]|nr:Cutinase [Paramyrothecium foliicola]
MKITELLLALSLIGFGVAIPLQSIADGDSVAELSDDSTTTELEQDVASFSSLRARQYASDTSNQLIDGTPCRKALVIYARGTSQAGNLGATNTLGPVFLNRLASLVGANNLAVQGVDYAANAAGFLIGGDPAGSKTLAQLTERATTQCPNTKVVLSGYSQGAQVVHNGADQLSASTAALLTFGDPKQKKSFGSIPASRTRVICHADDNICNGGFIINEPHTTYQTDVPDAAAWVAARWHEKVFDEEIVAKWRHEALEQSEKGLFDEIVYKSRIAFPNKEEEQNSDNEEDTWSRTQPIKVPFPRSRIISPQSFDYCITELRSKAKHFAQTGFIPTLDSIGRAIAKSDSAVDLDVKSTFRAIFDELRADQKATKGIDWHPRTNEMVQDLVHPSLYPFVYGRSCFIQDEVVGVDDAIAKWAGKGALSPGSSILASDPAQPSYYSTIAGDGNDWSERYQWLPANLSFQEDGSLRFTSYVNNLHPHKYAHVYRALEQLVGLAIPAWDQVLVAEGRKESRFSIPDWAHDRESEGLWEPFDAALLSLFPRKPTLQDLEDMSWDNEWPEQGKLYQNGVDIDEMMEKYHDEIVRWKWNHIRDAIFPEPDSEEKVNYSCEQSIRDTYKDSGLQVIVKMAHIELTPDKPEFSGGGWHVEGMINERICGTALYYLDSENITPSYLAFRTLTDRDQDNLSYGQNAYNWLERVYGVDFNSDACLQSYGRVETPEGRMLAFPNDLLVDPGQRIVSTANVPPQQLDWWTEAVFGQLEKNSIGGDQPHDIIQHLLQVHNVTEFDSNKAAEGATKLPQLPQELITMIAKRGGTQFGGLMSHEEALNHRLQLMNERSVLQEETNESRNAETYNFYDFPIDPPLRQGIVSIIILNVYHDNFASLGPSELWIFKSIIFDALSGGVSQDLCKALSPVLGGEVAGQSDGAVGADLKAVVLH